MQNRRCGDGADRSILCHSSLSSLTSTQGNVFTSPTAAAWIRLLMFSPLVEPQVQQLEATEAHEVQTLPG